ncbi:hypothetical protein ET428_27955, partial [Salmonella enterica]|nr:hypothetical protein [Salmonella enterica]EBN6863708.1 hypothetical protein [Salmonella enterica]
GAAGKDGKPVQAACAVCAGYGGGEKRDAALPWRDGTGVSAALSVRSRINGKQIRSAGERRANGR